MTSGMPMGDTEVRGLRMMQLRFIGKIMAGFTHEIKNYLAIINESAGLMGDMIKVEKPPRKNVQEYLDIIRSIEDQIERAAKHFTHLNRFSHRMDTETSTFNLNECLEELIALMNRSANKKRISLERDFQRNLSPVHSNPSMLQFLVFSLIDQNIEGLDKNSRITVRTGITENSVTISIIPEGNFVETDVNAGMPQSPIHESIIRQLGGSTLQGAGKETIITLPSVG